MFPNFCDLSNEGYENRCISGDQNASVLPSHYISSGLLCYICGNGRDLFPQSLSNSLQIDWMERLWWDSVFYLLWFCFRCMETRSLICSLNHWIDWNVPLSVPLEWNWWSEIQRFPFFQSSIDFKWDTGSKSNHRRGLTLIITNVIP